MLEFLTMFLTQTILGTCLLRIPEGLLFSEPRQRCSLALGFVGACRDCIGGSGIGAWTEQCVQEFQETLNSKHYDCWI